MAEEDRTYTATVINSRAGHNFLLYCSRLSERTSPRQEISFRHLTMATRVNPSSLSYSCTARGRKALSKAAHFLHILLLPHVLTLLGVSSTAWVNYTLQQLLSPNELAALYSFKTQMCYTSTGYTTVISVSSVLSEASVPDPAGFGRTFACSACMDGSIHASSGVLGKVRSSVH